MYKLLSSNVEDDSFISVSLEKESEFTKTAATRDLPKEVDEAIKNMARKPNHSYVLTTAMGDGETWGSNKNGDIFPYDALMGLQNKPVKYLGKTYEAEKDERLNKDLAEKMRYQTFDDSHFFHHHRNKIDKGDPDFGYVEKAIWNPKMRTVLLIVGVDRNKDQETAEMIDRNQLIAVSMGAKLPYDFCSYCRSKHKTIMQYCPHLKLMMGKIMPNGVRVGAVNLFPRFFDISRVNRPAFLAGMQLEKVAYTNGIDFSIDLAELYDIGRFDKLAEHNKQAVINKQIPLHIEGAIHEVSKTEKDIPHSILEDLSKLKPQQAWGALTHAGIIAKPNEFAYILLKSEGHHELADKFIHANAIVNKPDIKGLDVNIQNLASIHIDHKAESLGNSIPESTLNERSIGTVNDRIYDISKGLRKEAEVQRTIGLGAILSSLYLLYRNNAESHFNAYGLLAGGVSAMISDTQKTDKYIGNDGSLVEELNKKAGFMQSGKGMAIRGIGGFVAPYILSAHYQNKINNGEQVGIVGQTIANNPGKLGLIGAAAGVAPKVMYGGLKQIGSDAISGIGKLIKPKI